MSLPENYQHLEELVGTTVTAKRSGWDATPDDDTDLTWQDEGANPEISGEFGYILVPRSYINFVALVNKLPVDPDTIATEPATKEQWERDERGRFSGEGGTDDERNKHLFREDDAEEEGDAEEDVR